MQQMTSAVEKMKADIDRLSRREQVQLLGYLMRSIDDGHEGIADQSAFDTELLRRKAAADCGAEPGEPAEKVFRELREERG